MNKKRLAASGLGAGAVLTLLDAVINVRLLGVYGLYGHAWVDAAALLGVSPNPWGVGAYWTAMCFLSGLLQVWLYVAVQPRLPPGVKTAVITASFIWLFTHMAVVGDLVSGVFPARLIIPVCVLELFTTVAASAVGARLYDRSAP